MSANLFDVQVEQPNEVYTFFKEQIKINEADACYDLAQVKLFAIPGNERDNFSDQLLQAKTIILKTTDCLADYCRLKTAGIRFKEEPFYQDNGLHASFSDPFGNHYLLIEYRNYHED